MTPATYFQQLNTRFLEIAGHKEKLFWTTYMGTADSQTEYAEAETAFRAFTSDPALPGELRRQIDLVQQQSPHDNELLHGLKGWLAFFETFALESVEARELAARLTVDDSALFTRRKALSLSYTDAQGQAVEASTPVLSTNLVSSDDESVRKSSHAALLQLERWVVDNGFVEMVQKRNAFARALGYRNYFDLKVNRDERMTPEALFDILDPFEAQTREAQQRGFEDLVSRHGDNALAAHNLNFYRRGDTTHRMDPYLPFSKSLQRWVESFGRMGVSFRNARLTLDLLDRKGKYENGFMHAPSVAWNREGVWQPAAINFTSNANPGQVGSGYRGLNTLFHEGGHAAHFANITQNAPCFSQEFAPTTMSYAETQSMFFDSLLGDADWLKLYARDSAGLPIPDDLIRENIAASQPYAAYTERCILVVPYFEWALYSLPDDELCADTLIALARHWEKKILGLECAPRPLLAIPHLLNQENACSYHGYLLANMAVYQTRAWLKQEYGYLTDNPNIGGDLAAHYWAPGNSVQQNETLLSLTGKGLTPRYLAQHCQRTTDEAWTEAAAELSSCAARTQARVQPLCAAIRVVHGAETLADNDISDEKMFSQFANWVEHHYA